MRSTHVQSARNRCQSVAVMPTSEGGTSLQSKRPFEQCSNTVLFAPHDNTPRMPTIRLSNPPPWSTGMELGGDHQSTVCSPASAQPICVAHTCRDPVHMPLGDAITAAAANSSLLQTRQGDTRRKPLEPVTQHAADATRCHQLYKSCSTGPCERQPRSPATQQTHQRNKNRVPGPINKPCTADEGPIQTPEKG